MGIISGSRGRICRWLSGFDNSIFFQDTFIIISYVVYEDKNYINGFVKVKNYDANTVEITYICSDLNFTGIGKLLISLVKLIITLLNISLIILESVNRGSTQNFYTSQGFQYVKNKGDKVVFFTNTRKFSRKDQINIGKIYNKLNSNKPLLITYNPSKFELNKDEIDPTELLPYNEIRKEGSPQPSPRHFTSPRSVRESPRSARDDEEGLMFRDVLTPRSSKARGKKHKKKTKKHKRYKKV
jgi:hypothetical protein